ncbi:hypothetical protein ACN47E_009477 [Coniothyrium glycines]
MPNPQLEVSLLKPEEAEQYMRIRHEVFRPTINKIIYSHGEPSQKTLDRVTQDIRDEIVNKGLIYLKCVDKSTGEMIAGARWRHATPKEAGAQQRTWQEVEAGFTTPEPYAESEPDLFRSIFDLFHAHKREILGTKAVLHTRHVRGAPPAPETRSRKHAGPVGMRQGGRDRRRRIPRSKSRRGAHVRAPWFPARQADRAGYGEIRCHGERTVHLDAQARQSYTDAVMSLVPKQENTWRNHASETASVVSYRLPKLIVTAQSPRSPMSYLSTTLPTPPHPVLVLDPRNCISTRLPASRRKRSML